MDDDVRQRIINSLFSRRGPSGVVEEQYISHCKIYEDAGPNQATGVDEAGRKARYILLSRVSRSLLIRLHPLTTYNSPPRCPSEDPQVKGES